MSKGALGIMLECDLVGLGQSGVSHQDRGEWGCSRGEFCGEPCGLCLRTASCSGRKVQLK